MRSTCAQDNITEEDEAWSRGLPYVSPSVPPSVPDTANASVSCLYPRPIYVWIHDKVSWRRAKLLVVCPLPAIL